MKNTKNAKIKPFGLFKRLNFSAPNLEKKEFSNAENGENAPVLPFKQAEEERFLQGENSPISLDEQENFPFQEENNPFISFCDQHDKRAKRLKKR